MNVTGPFLRCILCDSPSFAVTPFFYLFGNAEIRVVRCSSCGLGRLHPMLSENEVISLYDSEYFLQDYHCGLLKRPYSEEIEALRKEARPTLEVVKKFSRGPRFLEIGCAGGAMRARSRMVSRRAFA